MRTALGFTPTAGPTHQSTARAPAGPLCLLEPATDRPSKLRQPTPTTVLKKPLIISNGTSSIHQSGRLPNRFVQAPLLGNFDLSDIGVLIAFTIHSEKRSPSRSQLGPQNHPSSPPEQAFSLQGTSLQAYHGETNPSNRTRV
ncbi:hypothetical protein H4Q26_016552 [Puccinia striiformis f. sp. tritici PST-130]|nr:hypothetical protein H4Q26_016552 [Puccinia striiformis f. sp. tritici PST-130]